MEVSFSGGEVGGRCGEDAALWRFFSSSPFSVGAATSAAFCHCFVSMFLSVPFLSLFIPFSFFLSHYLCRLFSSLSSSPFLLFMTLCLFVSLTFSPSLWISLSHTLSILFYLFAVTKRVSFCVDDHHWHRHEVNGTIISWIFYVELHTHKHTHQC